MDDMPGPESPLAMPQLESAAGKPAIENDESLNVPRPEYDMGMGILTRLETLPCEKIKKAGALAADLIVGPEMYRVLELNRSREQPHPYELSNAQRFAYRRRVAMEKQLSASRPDSLLTGAGLNALAPERARVPVLGPDGLPIRVMVVQKFPLEDLWGRPLNKKGEVVAPQDQAFEIKKQIVEKTIPVSNEQLLEAGKAMVGVEARIADVETLLKDMVVESMLSGEVEGAIQGFGANWKNEPTLDVLARTFRREGWSEEMPESRLLNEAMNVWDLVGSLGQRGGGGGLKNVFGHCYTMDEFETAIRFVAARLLDKKPGEIPASVEEGWDNDRYLAARSIAQESYALFRYLWKDTDYSVWRKGKSVKPGDKYNKMGFPVGAPLWGLETDSWVSKDAMKIAWMPVRVVSEVGRDHPFGVGSAKYIAASLFRLTFNDLAIMGAVREGKDGRVQRISFQKLIEMGMPYDKLPFTEYARSDLHEYFNRAYETSKDEEENWENAPTGPRGDSLHVPVGLQRFYSAKDWVDLTEAKVAEFVKEMTDPAKQFKENKPDFLYTQFLSANLLLEDGDPALLKLTQYHKVHKLAAAYMAEVGIEDSKKGKTGGEENDGASLAEPLTRQVVGYARDSLATGKGIPGGGLVGVARQAKFFSPKTSVAEDRVMLEAMDGSVRDWADMEKVLFVASITRRRGIMPYESGWFTLDELVKIAPLFPYGVGLSQFQIKDLALGSLKSDEYMKVEDLPRIGSVQTLMDLGWTGDVPEKEADLRFKEEDWKKMIGSGMKKELTLAELVWLKDQMKCSENFLTKVGFVLPEIPDLKI